MSKYTDTNIKLNVLNNEAQEADGDVDNYKLALLDEKISAIRDQRVEFIGVLEGYIEARVLTTLEAVLKFEKATLMARPAALKYLKNMSQEGSPFKSVYSLKGI